MKKTILATAFLALVAVAAPRPAAAHVSFFFGLPGFGIFGGPPVAVAPAPLVVAPPVYAPPVYYPRPFYGAGFYPGYRYRYWHGGWHGGWHHHGDWH